MAKRILGMGDVVSLIENAVRVQQAEEEELEAERMMRGQLTLDDFLMMNKQVRKMGGVSKLISALPGGDKALGSGNTDNYESITYEGYGPSGVAIIVETMTDNRNRTASEVRHYFDKYGGNMGATGCVSWSFDKKGVIVINDEDQELDEDKVMEDALEAGAADFAPDEGVYTVYTDPDDVASVAEALTNDGYELLSAQVEMVPQNTIKLTDEGDIKNLQKMLDMFEDNEDVQNVWHNWEE